MQKEFDFRMIEFCTMSLVPYFTHTHFVCHFVCLRDNRGHERREICAYIAGPNFRTSGVLFVHCIHIILACMGSM